MKLYKIYNSNGKMIEKKRFENIAKVKKYIEIHFGKGEYEIEQMGLKDSKLFKATIKDKS